MSAPESLEDLIKRIISHAARHLQAAAEAAEHGEWDTCDFLLAIVSNDVITARSAINSKLQFLRKAAS